MVMASYIENVMTKLYMCICVVIGRGCCEIPLVYIIVQPYVALTTTDHQCPFALSFIKHNFYHSVYVFDL